MYRMSKRLCIAISILLILLCSTVFYLQPTREPIYKECTLSEWYARIPPDTGWTPELVNGVGAFGEAVQENGTNCMPFLLEMLRSPQYSQIRAKLVGWANDNKICEYSLHHHFQTESDRVAMEQDILYWLGPKATPFLS